MATGELQGLALKSDGTVVGWGESSHYHSGQLGVPEGLSDVTAIAAGNDHSLVTVSK
jgi:alpha-tubulin suppressor-like RCC1 family protein